MRLLLFTGCRKSEILTLRWSDYRDGHLYLRDSKTGPRTVWLSRPARDVLENINWAGTWVFPGQRAGQPASQAWLWIFWKRVRAEADLPDVRLHDLRHTFASFALRQGESVLVIGRLLGHSTIYRWVQHFAPEMEKRLRWQWRRPQSRRWRIDETYVKVRGEWAYLYRAVDKLGNTIDFFLSSTRNTKAAKRFLGKALRGMKDWELPEVLNTDKAPTYAGAIAELKAAGKCPKDTRHRQVKYLNNVVEADHGKLKQLIRPVRGFKALKTAYATIKGFEVMRALRKGQARFFNLEGGIVGEARIV